jgi:hypothetical protein
VFCDGCVTGVRFLAGIVIVFFASSPRQTLESIQPPMKWVPRALFLGQSRFSVEISTIRCRSLESMELYLHPLCYEAFEHGQICFTSIRTIAYICS